MMGQEFLRKRVCKIPTQTAVILIRLYRKYISPAFAPCCRYVPTCSEYAMIAICRFGFIKGLWLAIKRICRCNPWYKGGFDPVPKKL